MLNHFYQTHDIWHVVTGWGNDLPGELELGTFYAAQFGNPAFFGFMLALVMVNVVRRRADPQGLGRLVDAPLISQNPIDQELSAKRCRLRVMMFAHSGIPSAGGWRGGTPHL